MRKRFLKQLHKINRIMPRPGKLVRRQQFISKMKNKRRHGHRYSQYSYDKPKSSRFNRWDHYTRSNNKSV